MASNSFTFDATGFSTSTCLPASIAAIASSACDSMFVKTKTASDASTSSAGLRKRAQP